MREKAAAARERGGENAQIDVRIAKLRATWTGSPEELELAVERLLKKARKALSDLGAAANLDAEDKAKLKRAREEGRLVEEERLIKKARKALSDRGAEANPERRYRAKHRRRLAQASADGDRE